METWQILPFEVYKLINLVFCSSLVFEKTYLCVNISVGVYSMKMWLLNQCLGKPDDTNHKYIKYFKFSLSHVLKHMESWLTYFKSTDLKYSQHLLNTKIYTHIFIGYKHSNNNK